MKRSKSCYVNNTTDQHLCLILILIIGIYFQIPMSFTDGIKSSSVIPKENLVATKPIEKVTVPVYASAGSYCVSLYRRGCILFTYIS